MATYWLGEGGNDGNNGTTYALRKLTTAAALALLTTKGDILNVVGTVDMDTTHYIINGISLGNEGTSYDDPALIIRGTDSSGDPAMAVLLGDATHAAFVTFDDRVNFAIIRGIHFDQSITTNSYTTYPIKIEGIGQTPILFQYCIFEGDATEQTPGQRMKACRANAFRHADQVGGEFSENEVLAQHCYFDHSSMAADTAHPIHADHCVFYTTTFALAASPVAAVNMDTNTQRYAVGTKMTNCTLDYWHACSTPGGARHFEIVRDYIADTTTSREREVHSNLICVASSELMAANQLWNGGMIDGSSVNITGVWGGIVGYNAFVFDDNVVDTIASTSIVDFYKDHYHPDQPNTTTGTKIYDTDVQHDRDVIGSFIEGTSAWTWTDINNGGYNIDLPKDYRLSWNTSALITMAEDGGRVGAIQENVNRTPTAIDPTYRADENIVMDISAALGLLNGATDPDAGDTLSITSMGTPAHGTLVSYNITTGSFVYRPDPFYSGADSFTYKVSDGTTNSATATATIFVFPASSAVVTNLVDTAPFFRPSLFVETEFRTKWKKNRKKALNESNYTDGQQWNESTSRSIMLTPSATATVTLGGIASAKYLILETDQDIEVSIDGTDKYWPVSKVVAVAMTEFASISLHSLSTTNAQVILTVVD